MIHENIKGLDDFITALPKERKPEMVKCEMCNGKGVVAALDGGELAGVFSCPECDGTGEIEQTGEREEA